LARKFTLALTSDLLDVLLPLLHKIKPDFLKEAVVFQEKLLLALGDKMPNWQTLQRQLFRGTVQEDMTPEWLVSPYFLEGQIAFSHLRQFKSNTQMRGILQIYLKSIMPDL
jgi:hypothetical protein